MENVMKKNPKIKISQNHNYLQDLITMNKYISSLFKTICHSFHNHSQQN